MNQAGTDRAGALARLDGTGFNTDRLAGLPDEDVATVARLVSEARWRRRYLQRMSERGFNAEALKSASTQALREVDRVSRRRLPVISWTSFAATATAPHSGGFTGEIKDKRGRRRCYQGGHETKCQTQAPASSSGSGKGFPAKAGTRPAGVGGKAPVAGKKAAGAQGFRKASKAPTAGSHRPPVGPSRSQGSMALAKTGKGLQTAFRNAPRAIAGALGWKGYGVKSVRKAVRARREMMAGLKQAGVHGPAAAKFVAQGAAHVLQAIYNKLPASVRKGLATLGKGARAAGRGVAAGAKGAARGVAAAGKAAWKALPEQDRRFLTRTGQVVLHNAHMIDHAMEEFYNAQRDVAREVARQKGLKPAQVNRVMKTLGAFDAAARWTVNIPVVEHGLHHVGLQGFGALLAAKVGYWIPVTSLGYIGYSAAQHAAIGDPLMVIRAANKTLDKVAHKLANAHTYDPDAPAEHGHGHAPGKHSERWSSYADKGPTNLRRGAALFADRIKKLSDRQADWYQALVAAAGDQGADLVEAVQWADKAFDRQPLPPRGQRQAA